MSAPARPGRPVIELDFGITVYPARFEGDRWRAVWYEDGERQQCQSVREEKLAAKLEKAKERLQADAPNMKRPGAALIAHYLDPDRLPVEERWSRKHAHTQRRLCERFAAPVINTVICQDIKIKHTQKIVNAAPTAGEGARVARMLSALVGAGIDGGYLVNPRLAKVHWQAAGRPVPPPRATVAGESALFVDPAEIPAAADVARLGRALAAQQDLYELMACFAAYTGLRWGELAALTTTQITPAVRTVDVDRKVIEIGGTGEGGRPLAAAGHMGLLQVQPLGIIPDAAEQPAATGEPCPAACDAHQRPWAHRVIRGTFIICQACRRYYLGQPRRCA